MPIKSVKIKDLPDNKQNKRAEAILTDIDGTTKSVKFGYSKAKSTYYDGADDDKKNAYIARHKVNEEWDNPYTAGFYSRWVLWEHRSKEKNKIINEIKKNSKIPLGKITIDLKKKKVSP